MSAQDDFLEAVLDAVVVRDERMTLRCADAFRLAKDYDVEPMAIAAVCNANKIKIVQCQLGCFK